MNRQMDVRRQSEETELFSDSDLNNDRRVFPSTGGGSGDLL